MKDAIALNDVTAFEDRLAISFAHKELLVQALTHRSYLNENPQFGLGHNERLEFLGDAVLELVVTEELYCRFPDKPEGELTSFRAALVNSNMLSDIATALGVNDFLLLSRGEAKDVGRARQYILANAFEAIIGAIYLDAGYNTVKRCIKRVLFPHLSEVLEKKLYKDPKSLFQEKAQERVGITPRYDVVREWGPDHDKHFVVGVFLSDELVAEGEGPSKQIAQEAAARNALTTKEWI